MKIIFFIHSPENEKKKSIILYVEESKRTETKIRNHGKIKQKRCEGSFTDA